MRHKEGRNWLVTMRRNCLLKHVFDEKVRGQDRGDGKTRKET